MSSELPPIVAPPRSILFVCTGNTCRSPLAERLCLRLLASRLGCRPEEVESRGIRVQSAGVMAYPGERASPLAIVVATEFGAQLADHRSQPVTAELLDSATDVITMTASHRSLLQHRFPNFGPEPELLVDGGDLPDPIGGDLDEYRACAQQIAKQIDRFITRWLGT